MSRPYPALCRNCKHSKPEERSEWYLRCQHPIVTAKDPWALAGGGPILGSECRSERERRSLFAPCGMRGKLWEAVPAAPIDAAGKPVHQRADAQTGEKQ